MWNLKELAHVFRVFSPPPLIVLFFLTNLLDINGSKSFGQSLVPLEQNGHITESRVCFVGLFQIGQAVGFFSVKSLLVLQ